MLQNLISGKARQRLLNGLLRLVLILVTVVMLYPVFWNI